MKKVLFTICMVFFITSCLEIRGDKERMLGYDFRLYQDTPAWGLAKAVARQDTAKITYWVQKKGVPIDFREERFGQTLLMTAAMTGKCQSVEKLLQLGANPNLADTCQGRTTLTLAIELGRKNKLELVKLLLRYGADPNGKAEGSPFYPLAATIGPWGDIEIVKQLVEYGADVTRYEKRYGSLATAACVQQNYDIALYLLERGSSYYDVPASIDSTYPDIIMVLKRDMLYRPEGEEYETKRQIVRWLKKHAGIDYNAYPVPAWFIRDHLMRVYPDDWQEILDADNNNLLPRDEK